MISLVSLRVRARHLDHSNITAAARRVFGGVYQETDIRVFGGEGNQTESGRDLLMVLLPDVSFIIHDFSEPYFDMSAGDEFLDQLDPRAAVRIREHNAWLSVDAVMASPSLSPDALYRFIARLHSEFADDECLLLYRPEDGRWWDFSVPALECLAGENPNQSLPDVTDPPIGMLAADDPRIFEASAEAQRRFGEFRAAFEDRQDGEDYLVKFALTDGVETEHIWMSVESISHTRVHGRLDNRPLKLRQHQLGDPVTTGIEEIEDWYIVGKNRPSGGFSIDLVQSVIPDPRDGMV